MRIERTVFLEKREYGKDSFEELSAISASVAE